MFLVFYVSDDCLNRVKRPRWSLYLCNTFVFLYLSNDSLNRIKRARWSLHIIGCLPKVAIIEQPSDSSDKGFVMLAS